MEFSKKNTINKLFNFKDKIVLITGANGLIGKNLCKLYLDLGSKVYGIDNKKNYFKKRNYIHLKGSVTEELFLKKKLAELIKNNSKIDIIINCAAISPFTHFTNRTKKEIYDTLNTNFFGTHNVIKNYAKIHIKKKLKHCRIINFGSIYGMMSPDFRIYEKNDRFNSEIYGASKALIIQMTKYLGVMYAKKNIFINCISPGGTIDPNKRLSKNFYNRYSARVPLGRMALPRDLNTAVIYLSSEETNYTIGQNIVIDGGLTVW